MRLAADQRHPQIDHRVAVDARLELRADALLDARDELPGDRAADHPVDELETAALRQRFDLDLGDRVLPVPAGLLDVPAQAVRGGPHRLADGDPDRLDHHLDAGPGAQPVEQHLELLLAHGPHQQLLGCRVDLRPGRWGPPPAAGPGPARACPPRSTNGPRSQPAAGVRASSRARARRDRQDRRGCRRSRRGPVWRPRRCRRPPRAAIGLSVAPSGREIAPARSSRSCSECQVSSSGWPENRAK